MIKTNKVFIATSLDGFIADKNGGIDWLHSVPNPDNIDMGYEDFLTEIDAIIMGRNSFETILGFDIEWPYEKPVFVLSTTLSEVPENLAGSVFLVNGPLQNVLRNLHDRGLDRLYIDGGKTIQSFLKEDLIDEMILTTIPVVLGAGIPLFSELTGSLDFQCKKSEIYLDAVVQNTYVRQRQ